MLIHNISVPIWIYYFVLIYVIMIEEQKEKESTIVIKNDIREQLKKIGYKGQTYNEIIAKLIDSKGNKIDSLHF
jgi:sensor domain CHASE-containing protein